MKIVVLFFGIFFSSHSFCQNIVKGNVFSNTTHERIPYATIHIYGTKNTIDADSNGFFEIVAQKEDTLLISCIGFRDTTVPVLHLDNVGSVFLTENIITLNEVKIGKSSIQTVGILNEKFGSSRVGGNMAERSELTTLIEVPANVDEYRVNKIYIKGKRYDENNPIRLHIYSVNKYGLPDEELLKRSIIINKKNFKKETISVDLSDQNIFLEKSSFFVGIQWITDEKVKWPTGPEIVQTSKVSEILSYYRSENHKYWFAGNLKSMIVFPENKTPGIGTLKGNPLNMCASAEIEIFSH